jgi:hypothetical protein
LVDLHKEDFKNKDTTELERIANEIIQGKAEFYFNKMTSDNYGSDNIYVYKQTGRIPQNISEVKRECDNLPSSLSRRYGKPVKVYSCELRKISSLNAFYIDFDGIVENTINITYMIPFPQNVSTFFMLGCKK